MSNPLPSRYARSILFAGIRPRRCVVELLAAAVVLLAFAAPASPAAAADGSFSITPSRRDILARPPVTLAPTTVSNTTKSSYDVRAFPVVLRQGLSGAFEFDETPRALNTARMIMRVSPSRFRLAPGQSRKVAVRWELLARGRRAAYVGVIFQSQQRTANGGSVPVLTRLLSTNFMRLPGRYHPNGVFSGLRASQAEPKVLRFKPRVRNTGDVRSSPKNAHLTITDSTGRTVYRTTWTGDVVLPRAQREFPIDVRKILPAGDYSARASMSFGPHGRRISSKFTLVGPNQLPTPDVKVNAFAATGEVGAPAHVTADVHSTGTSPATLNLTLSLFRVDAGQPDGTPLATRKLHFAALAPGSTRPLDAQIGKRLATGRYHVVATYVDATGAPQELTSDFAATVKRGFLDRVRQFVRRHETLIFIVIGLIVVAGLVLGLLRRQRRLEAELREAKAQRDPDPPAS